ncbi:hypothetical protein QBC35DRAFT_471926 [Podospora australis]|uniref:Uncharacterized protein n=1 Tax=Podospora australis TaxID=1536484 RepID=A0AAN7AIV1_9PEZI|nr:hypothetical protein QBC35DRAFT_471926 [Podospora australis]
MVSESQEPQHCNVEISLFLSRLTVVVVGRKDGSWVGAGGVNARAHALVVTLLPARCSTFSCCFLLPPATANRYSLARNAGARCTFGDLDVVWAGWYGFSIQMRSSTPLSKRNSVSLEKERQEKTSRVAETRCVAFCERRNNLLQETTPPRRYYTIRPAGSVRAQIQRESGAQGRDEEHLCCCGWSRGGIPERAKRRGERSLAQLRREEENVEAEEAAAARGKYRSASRDQTSQETENRILVSDAIGGGGGDWRLLVWSPLGATPKVRACRVLNRRYGDLTGFEETWDSPRREMEARDKGDTN